LFAKLGKDLVEIYSKLLQHPFQVVAIGFFVAAALFHIATTPIYIVETPCCDVAT
jgi:hypothetical protein